jgi:hypothetical protein
MNSSPDRQAADGKRDYRNNKDVVNVGKEVQERGNRRKKCACHVGQVGCDRREAAILTTQVRDPRRLPAGLRQTAGMSALNREDIVDRGVKKTTATS